MIELITECENPDVFESDLVLTTLAISWIHNNRYTMESIN